MNSSGGNARTERVAVDFIDPLFAVVISISLRQIMGESWFGYAPFLRSDLEWFLLWSLLLGYGTVVLSWVGYHISIKNKPIKIETFPGFFRFLFDIVLLISYWLLLVKFASFSTQLSLLVVIYLAFIIWDILKRFEYKSLDTPNSRRRRGVSVFWLLVFGLLFYLYVIHLGRTATIVAPDYLDWAFLASAISATVAYRAHKHWPKPWWLLDMFAFHRPSREDTSKPLRIYVAGPYSADSREEINANVNRAIDAGIAIFLKGHFPYVPHLTDLIDKRAKERGMNITWNEFIDWDKPWISKSDAVLYLGKSKGADLEVEEAKRLGKRIFLSLESIPGLSRKAGSRERQT